MGLVVCLCLFLFLRGWRLFKNKKIEAWVGGDLGMSVVGWVLGEKLGGISIAWTGDFLWLCSISLRSSSINVLPKSRTFFTSSFTHPLLP